MKLKRVLSVLLLAVAVPTGALAVPVSNASFENYTLDPGVVWTGADNETVRIGANITGWTESSTDAAGLMNPGSVFFVSGEDPAGLIGFLKNEGSVSQTIEGYAMAANTELALSVDLGYLLTDKTGKGVAPNYSISLSSGDQIFASLTGTLVGKGTFTTVTLTYLTQSTDPFGSPLTITISNEGLLDGQLYSGQLAFDNVTLNDRVGVAVPEPGTILLLGAGVLGLGLMRRRKTY